MKGFRISDKNRSDIPENILIERALLKEKLDVIKAESPHLLRKYINHLYRNESARSVNINTAIKYTREVQAFLTGMLERNVIDKDDIVHIDAKDMEDIYSEDIQDYIDSCGSYVQHAKDGEKVIFTNSTKTLSLKQTCIKSFFTWLYKNNYIEKNETEKLRKILSGDSPSVLTLSDEEVKAVLELASTGECSAYGRRVSLSRKELENHSATRLRDIAILSMFIYHGLRISELQHLNLSSLNFEKGYFEIFRKRNKKKMMYFSRHTVAALQNYMEYERPKENIKPGSEDALFLSSSRNGRSHTRLSIEQIRKLVKKYACRVSMNPKISPHKLRATFATKSLEITGNIFTVQQILDHSSTATTQKYLRDNERAKREVSELINYE